MKPSFKVAVASLTRLVIILWLTVYRATESGREDRKAFIFKITKNMLSTAVDGMTCAKNNTFSWLKY